MKNKKTNVLCLYFSKSFANKSIHFIFLYSKFRQIQNHTFIKEACEKCKIDRMNRKVRKVLKKKKIKIDLISKWLRDVGVRFNYFFEVEVIH